MLVSNEAAVLKNLFSESVYYIDTKKEFLVIVDHPSETGIPAQVKDAFFKIFQALGVNENQYNIFNKGYENEDSLNINQFKNIILIGTTPPQRENIPAPEKYKPVNFADKTFLKADKMEVILNDKGLKKKFWDALKTLQ